MWGETHTHGSEGEGARQGGEEMAGPLAMLRRPFSLAGRRDGDGFVEVELIHRVVGVGTVDNIRSAAGNDLLSLSCQISTGDGDPICTVRSTIVARGTAGDG